MLRILPLLLLLAWPAMAQRFEFVALGDMPYNVPADHPRYDRLIDRINAVNPVFSIHVGDTKAGSTPCTDEMILRSKEHFDRFAGAVVYTVGDNEWTDCHRRPAGGFDPLERLAFVRRIHFAEARSLGQRPIAVERQADLMPAHATYVENARWLHNGVRFVSVHIVGSNNNFEPRAGAPEEFMARNAANLAWIAEGFAQAEREGALGLVFAFQADMWQERTPRDDLSSGFADTVRALTEGAVRFGRPVLMIHGDSHVLTIDQPLRDRGRATIENATRLMVMGASEVHAVRVTVDPAEPGLFSFTPLRVPENAARPRM
ncbi:hypothetical protein ACE7GA_06550 [Roseomonas sp. CCTCC AB2023176]|uniref:hypothetical protein n=1 Tax=Roseomonas sp. CCTCC AB2023176 TaxID=3342640 RepID=UPI0035E2EE02